MDEKRRCASCSYFDMDLGRARGQWYACSLHKKYIVDDSQAEKCPDFTHLKEGLDKQAELYRRSHE